MTLDPTARFSNVQDSLKKYLVDSLETIEGIELSFDKILDDPRTVEPSTNRWVSVKTSPVMTEALSEAKLELFCVTRADPERYKLWQLRDTVLGYFSDEDNPSVQKSIPFYRSRAAGAWTLIGGLVVSDIREDLENLRDNSQLLLMTITLNYASKV